MHLRNQIRVFAAGACLLSGCSSAPPPSRPPNILLVVIDTLRADRVDWYGGQRQLTPFMDSLADHSVTFANAYAQSSWTVPSVASLLTSRYPSQHGMRTRESVLAQEELTLTEVLKERGYATAAFIANPLLRASAGYGQGFDTFQVFAGAPKADAKPGGMFPTRKERGERLNQESVAWLDRLASGGQARTPLFLYVQYMEPHIPYTAPEDIVDQLMNRRENPAQERQAYGRMLFANPKLWNTPDTDALQVINDLYDAEVISVDARLRELFTELDRRGFFADSIVAITADHGDEHQEHGRMGHGTTLYNEVLKVPLLLRAPEPARGVAIPDVVSLIDVAPTVLELAGISPPASFEGHSLEPLVRARTGGGLVAGLTRLLGAPQQSTVSYSQLLDKPIGWPAPKRHDAAIVVGARKLLVGPDGSEGYDLDVDPEEQKPNGLTPTDQQRLLKVMEAASARAQRATRPEQVRTLSEQEQEEMRALCYGN